MGWLGGVRYTPHPDSLGFRLHCGTQGKALKEEEQTENVRARKSR